jgi:hypothetical protein
MEVYLHKVYLGSMSRDVHSCTHWLRTRKGCNPPPPLGLVLRGRYWSAKIDDSSLQPPAFYAKNLKAIKLLTTVFSSIKYGGCHSARACFPVGSPIAAVIGWSGCRRSLWPPRPDFRVAASSHWLVAAPGRRSACRTLYTERQMVNKWQPCLQKLALFEGGLTRNLRTMLELFVLVRSRSETFGRDVSGSSVANPGYLFRILIFIHPGSGRPMLTKKKLVVLFDMSFTRNIQIC